MTTKTKPKTAVVSEPPRFWWDVTLKGKGRKQTTLPVVAATEGDAIEQACRCLVQGKRFRLNVDEYNDNAVRETITVVSVTQLDVRAA